MNKDEMIKDIKAIIVRHHNGLGCNVLCDGDQCENCEFTAEDIYNAGYRKVGKDEIVVNKSGYEELSKDYATINDEAYYCGFSAGVEEAKQETREILQEVYDTFAKKVANGFTNRLYDDFTSQVVKIIANRHGIELERNLWEN